MKRSALLLGFLVAISAVVLTWNLDDGLPYAPHPDEVHCVPYTLPDGFNGVFGGFRYPGLSKSVYSVPRRLAGWSEDSPAIVLAARYLSAGLSLASLVLFFLLLKSLTPAAGDWIALAGTLTLACHHLFVACARLAWAESVLLFCLLGYFITLLQFHRRPSIGRLAAAAVLLGLLTGAKYSGLFLYLPLVTSIGLSYRRQPLWSFLGHVTFATSIFIGVFVATTPQLLVQPADFVTDFLWNTQHYAQGHPGLPTRGIPASYARSLGPLTLLLGCLALPLWLLKDRASFYLLVPWAVIYFVKLSGYRMAMGRNMLIVLPVLLIGLAQAATGLSRLRPRLRPGAALLALALLVLPQLPSSARTIPWRERRTTLDLAHGEINDLIPGHARVWRSAFTPPIVASEVTVGFFLDPQVLEAFEQGTLDYVILSESFIEGLKPGTFRYREDGELIRRLEAAGELALHVPAGKDLKGAGILVYRPRNRTIQDRGDG